MNTTDPHTPVLVGVAAIQQQLTDPQIAHDPLQLMIDAAHVAAADAHCTALLTDCDQVMVPQGMWDFPDPARVVAAGIGAPQAHSVFGKIGILQQSLIGMACERIQHGDADIILVCGGEARYRQLQARIQGISITDTPCTSTPDETLEPESEMWLEVEAKAGLLMPVGFYAILDSALRHTQGLTPARHSEQINTLYAGFSEIAARNPQAWKRDVLTAADLQPSAKNPLLAAPYTKLHCTQWNVDQATALFFCSAAKAQALGIPQQSWIYPCASTEANHVVAITQRAELHRSPGAKIAGDAALAAAGIRIQDIQFLELYSCFPAAVRLFAAALGITDDDSRGLTQAGGMSFAGGPLNNYVLHTTAQMAQRLREHVGSYGLVTSVSGVMNKQAYGIWRSAAPIQPFAFIDVTAQAAAVDIPIPISTADSGNAIVRGYTVLCENNLPQRVVAVCEFADGSRSVAWSCDAATLTYCLAHDITGRSIAVTHYQFTCCSL